LNPGRRGGKPATNRLSYGAAFLRGLLLTSEAGNHMLLRNDDFISTMILFQRITQRYIAEDRTFQVKPWLEVTNNKVS
jgi:hypothetical protein